MQEALPARGVARGDGVRGRSSRDVELSSPCELLSLRPLQRASQVKATRGASRDPDAIKGKVPEMQLRQRDLAEAIIGAESQPKPRGSGAARKSRGEPPSRSDPRHAASLRELCCHRPVLFVTARTAFGGSAVITTKAAYRIPSNVKEISRFGGLLVHSSSPQAALRLSASACSSFGAAGGQRELAAMIRRSALA